jgi:hypothetical protein
VVGCARMRRVCSVARGGGYRVSVRCCSRELSDEWLLISLERYDENTYNYVETT